MEPVAEIIHVTEYGFLAHDSSRQKLLQSHHAEIGDPKVWIASHYPSQDLCFQVCLRPGKMDQEITKACVEHLY